MKVCVMRNFRLKHNITLREIAAEVNRSQQWVSKIELGQVLPNDGHKRRLVQALQAVIMKRQRESILMELELQKMMTRFFEEEPEWTNPSPER